jgi:DNA-directed RNA polymerase subunit alpha
MADSSCPSAETLAAYVDGAAPPVESERVAEHLVGCGKCFGVFVEVIRFLEAPMAAERPVSSEVAAFWRGEGLPTRAANCLARAGISSWEGLAAVTVPRLLSRPGLGEVSVEQIRRAAAARGIRLREAKEG